MADFGGFAGFEVGDRRWRDEGPIFAAGGAQRVGHHQAVVVFGFPLEIVDRDRVDFLRPVLDAGVGGGGRNVATVARVGSDFEEVGGVQFLPDVGAVQGRLVLDQRRRFAGGDFGDEVGGGEGSVMAGLDPAGARRDQPVVVGRRLFEAGEFRRHGGRPS